MRAADSCLAAFIIRAMRQATRLSSVCVTKITKLISHKLALFGWGTYVSIYAGVPLKYVHKREKLIIMRWATVPAMGHISLEVSQGGR